MQFLATFLLAASAMALPTVTLTSRADGASCMDKGTKITEWTIRDFTFSSSKMPTAKGSVSFTLENPALAYKSKCSATSTHPDNFFYGNTNYNCEVPTQGDTASFTFDKRSNLLGITQHWSCIKEGGWIEAEGSKNVPLSCTASGDKKICKKVTFKAPVTNIVAVL